MGERTDAPARGSALPREPMRIAVLAALVLIALPLLLDVRELPSRILRPATTGDDYVAALARQNRNLVVNYIIGQAVHDVASGRIERVVVPRDPKALGDRPGDDTAGGFQPAIQYSLLRQVVGGPLVARRYDAALTAPEAGALTERWRREGRLRTYPRGVSAVVPRDAGDGVFVLYASGSDILVVPAPEIPRVLR